MIKPGTFVVVTKAYAGQGEFEYDGYEGNYTVIEHLKSGDVLLAKGFNTFDVDYGIAIHESRVKVIEKS